MKKTHIAITLFLFIATTTLTSCLSSADKVENAEDKLKDAQNKLDEVRQDSIADYDKFKKEADEKFMAHEKSINEFKARIANEKKESREKYEKQIADLEQKKYDLKKKLDEFQAAGKEGWEKYKSEFVNDMENLAKAINDLTVTNKK